MVGVGEAAYGTISPSLLADYFRKEFRGRVFGVFFLAIPVGFGLGLAIGGLMDVHFGWRSAFFVAGIPGLILAALALKLHDPPRGIQDDVTPSAAVTPSAPSHTLGVTGAGAPVSEHPSGSNGSRPRGCSRSPGSTARSRSSSRPTASACRTSSTCRR